MLVIVIKLSVFLLLVCVRLSAAESSRWWQVNHPYFSTMSELCEMQVDLSAPSQKVDLRLGSNDPERVACSKLSDSRARRSDGGERAELYTGKTGGRGARGNEGGLSPALCYLNSWNRLAERN